MTTPAQDGLRRWHELAAARDPAALPDLVAADAVFHSPAMFAPQPGRDLVVGYLSAALRVLGDDFHYERCWESGTGAVLEFRSTVGGREIHGVDIIEFTPDGTISDFTVMVRPLSALTTLVEHMRAELARTSGPVTTRSRTPSEQVAGATGSGDAVDGLSEVDRCTSR